MVNDKHTANSPALLPGMSAAGWLLLAIMLLSIMTSAAFFMGRATAPQAAHTGLSLDHIADVQAALDSQRARLADGKQSLSAGQAAVARRLGEMQAQIMRLNAAGQRLTELAEIQGSEFDFNAAPPLGGPTEPGDVVLAPTVAIFDQLEGELELKQRQLDVLQHLLLVSQLHSERYPSGWPVAKGWISSLFGKRTDPFSGRASDHRGIDFAASLGSDVQAVAGGVVAFAGKRTGYGNLVEINHGNGYVTRYGHNQRNTVRLGDRVEKGQIIAKVGKSGRATGPHVHFEVLVDGVQINPHQYVAKE